MIAHCPVITDRLAPGDVHRNVLLGALSAGEDPEEFADGIGADGAVTWNRYVTEAVNESLRGVRTRRSDFAADPGLVDSIVSEGNTRTNAIADVTLARVHEALNVRY